MTNEVNLSGLLPATVVSNNNKLHINQGGYDRSITLDTLLEKINSGTPFKLDMKEESSNFRILLPSDEQSYITCKSVGQTNIVLTNQSTANWKEGTVIYFRRDGGNVVFSGAAGVQINPSSSGFSLTEYGQVGALVRQREDVWDLVTGGNGQTVNSEFTAQSSTLGYTLGSVNKSQWMDIYGTNSNVVVTCPNESTIDLGPQFVHMITNYTIHPVTINAESGVTLEAPAGGSLVIPQYATAGIKKAHWSPNTYIVFGSTEAP